MTPQAVTINDETILVPKLTVQQIIDMSVLQNERDRADLLQDLKDSGIEGEERLTALRQHRSESGLSATVVRSAFTAAGAYQIVRMAMGGEFPESMNQLDPTKLSEIALGCLGIVMDDLVAEEDGSEGNDLEAVEIG
mgnify:CR=1 FL=1